MSNVLTPKLTLEVEVNSNLKKINYPILSIYDEGSDSYIPIPAIKGKDGEDLYDAVLPHMTTLAEYNEMTLQEIQYFLNKDNFYRAIAYLIVNSGIRDIDIPEDYFIINGEKFEGLK